jgi:hypothetical protein
MCFSTQTCTETHAFDAACIAVCMCTLQYQPYESRKSMYLAYGEYREHVFQGAFEARSRCFMYIFSRKDRVYFQDKDKNTNRYM